MNQRVQLSGITSALNLTIGKRIQLVDINPITGDYRVFYLGLSSSSLDEVTLDFELHRQGPGLKPRIFQVLSLAFGNPDKDGLCEIKRISSDVILDMEDLHRLLQTLASIATALQQKKRPEDALLLPLMSDAAQRLWVEPVIEVVES